jgi:hypothetical protein
MDKKYHYLLMIVLFVLVMFTINYSRASQSKPILPLEESILVKVEKTIVHYQKESFWSKDDFSKILKKREEIELGQIKRFKDDLFKFGEGEEYATCFDVKFNKATNSTVLRCDVLGAVSKSENSYRATFMWLLRPLKLDFIDSDFSESKDELFWGGLIDDVSTTVKVVLPLKDSVYAAWHHPNGHCHAHVWWTE